MARGVGRTGGAALALVAILLGLLLLDGSRSRLVDAQTTDHSTAVLLRTEIEEGQTRDFQISNVPDLPRYYIFFKPLSGYTAEASDLSIIVERRAPKHEGRAWARRGRHHEDVGKVDVATPHLRGGGEEGRRHR